VLTCVYGQLEVGSVDSTRLHRRKIVPYEYQGTSWTRSTIVSPPNISSTDLTLTRGYVVAVPPVFLSAFKADWTAAVQHLADVATTETGKHHNVPFCRLTILQTSELRPTILPPPIHPSVLPYILISEALLQVLRHEEVTQGNNIIPYVNSMVVFATVLAHFLRAPNTSPLDHWKQLRILLFRVEDEARKVVERGPVEGPNEEGTTIHTVQSTVKPKSCINWSWYFLSREIKRLMDGGWEYGALR
jgi:hypothetical protein